MPKTSTSLALAFVIHIIIIVVSSFFIEKDSSPFLIETKKFINVQLGSSSGGSAPRKLSIESLVLKAPSSSPATVALGTIQSSTAASQESGAESESGGGAGHVSGVGSGNGSDIYDFGNSAVSYKEPTYPRLAIKRELQGSVRVRVRVSPEGKPINTEILKSSGHDLLDKSVLEAIAYWQFQPKNTSYLVEKTIVFQLKN